MTKDLVLQCCTLPIQDRRGLILKLADSIHRDVPNELCRLSPAEEAEKLKRIACKVMGWSAFPKDRRKESVFAKQMVIYTLREYGDTFCTIGEAMGMNQSSMQYHICTFDYKLNNPQLYMREMDIYKRFLNELNNETQC